MDCIYFDNAATSWPKPEVMIKAMAEFNANVGANPGRSGHRLSLEASRIIFNARETIASLLGAEDPHTVIFTRNATEGINTIVRGLLRPGDNVITSSMEHNSVMRPLRALEAEGIELSVVQCSCKGDISPDDIIATIKKNTRMIIITHASNVTGTIMPIAEIAERARTRDVLVCVDAAQSAGNLPINVLKDNIDFLVFTGHKSLNGPQGTGGFYIRKGLETLINPLERGGTGSRSEFEEHPEFMPDRFESGTPNTIGIAGLGAGASHVAAVGIENIRKHEIAVTELFLDGISSIKGVKVYGDINPQMRTALVSFTIEGLSPSEISFELDERFNIMSRPGLHCAPSAHRTIGTFPDGTVRFSFGMFTTKEEIRTAINAIEILSREHKK
ncbi:MAG TPA: aminotransferase class V-fold PLP-dependent enzyme [Desulfobacteraceae bacterium]|nr:aminotransferase class V-fold PLP-dependent enzyme [Desulfobacteraceae bacterium]HPJ68090.1 aminotransferase class V-fold PLP-dependent enzyme [Desulfobacteraceae bacterium]HPQ28645.1 aminotransferase class V-fold PLP-dependent enzyme [Desulfobacteraceae bacterium]